MAYQVYGPPPELARELRDLVENNTALRKHPRWVELVDGLLGAATGAIQRLRACKTAMRE